MGWVVYNSEKYLAHAKNQGIYLSSPNLFNQLKGKKMVAILEEKKASRNLEEQLDSPNYVPKSQNAILTDYIHSDRYRQKQKLLDEKIARLYNYGHDQEIREKTIPRANAMGDFDYSKVDDTFRTAIITLEALRKGSYISKRIKEIASEPLEIYLYELGNPDCNGSAVTKDLYIAEEQNVWPSECKVTAMGVLKSKLSIRDKLKKRIIGWSHSHGSHDPSFTHSRNGDVDNTLNILNCHGLTKRIRVYDNTYGGEGYKGVEYEVRYTPAIVFNAANTKPFVAIAVEYTRSYDGQKVVHINEKGRLKVIKEVNGIDMNPESLDKQILERVMYNGRRVDEIAGRCCVSEPVKEEVNVPTEEQEKVLLIEQLISLKELYDQREERIERLEQRVERLERRNRRLGRRMYKGLQTMCSTLRKKRYAKKI